MNMERLRIWVLLRPRLMPWQSHIDQWSPENHRQPMLYSTPLCPPFLKGWLVKQIALDILYFDKWVQNIIALNDNAAWHLIWCHTWRRHGTLNGGKIAVQMATPFEVPCSAGTLHFGGSCFFTQPTCFAWFESLMWKYMQIMQKLADCIFSDYWNIVELNSNFHF